MRTLLVVLAIFFLTPPLALCATIAAYLGMEDRDGGIFEKLPRVWSRIILRVAGVKVVVHGAEHIRERRPRIFMSNHVSWFDVFALGAVLPRYKFIAKAELARIPIFGKGAMAAAMIPLERENRKSAFQSYEQAAVKIREGASVVVYPEGTRGYDYELRPFKKGAFVLAASARVPVVPVLIYGTIHVHAKGRLRVRPGRVDVHILEPIDTGGLAYDNREELARTVWARMADALRELYGIESVHAPVARGENVPKIPTSFL